MVEAAVSRVLAQDEAGPVERAGEDPGRLRCAPARRPRPAPRATAARPSTPASVATRVTMIIAVSRAAPRWPAPATAAARCHCCGKRRHGAISTSRTRLPLRPLPGAKVSTMRTPGRQEPGVAGRRRRRRWPATASAGRLAVAPGVALEEVDLPRSRPASGAELARLVALELLRAQPALLQVRSSSSRPGRPSAARPSSWLSGSQRPGDDLQAAFGAARQAHALAVAGERRHGGRSPGSPPGPAPTARSPSRGAASARAAPGSTRAPARCRRRPARPSAT